LPRLNVYCGYIALRDSERNFMKYLRSHSSQAS
jgi:hypothetical protein